MLLFSLHVSIANKLICEQLIVSIGTGKTFRYLVGAKIGQ